MRSIGRTFYWSKCYGQRYNYQTKELEDFSFDVLGNYTEKRATLSFLLKSCHSIDSYLTIGPAIN